MIKRKQIIGSLTFLITLSTPLTIVACSNAETDISNKLSQFFKDNPNEIKIADKQTILGQTKIKQGANFWMQINEKLLLSEKLTTFLQANQNQILNALTEVVLLPKVQTKDLEINFLVGDPKNNRTVATTITDAFEQPFSYDPKKTIQLAIKEQPLTFASEQLFDQAFKDLIFKRDPIILGYGFTFVETNLPTFLNDLRFEYNENFQVKMIIEDEALARGIIIENFTTNSSAKSTFVSAVSSKRLLA